MLSIPNRRRVTAALAAGVLCLLLAASVAAMPGDADQDLETGPAHSSVTQQTTTPADPVQGQLSGIVVVLAVLAVIGAAAWSVRAVVDDRGGVAEQWGRDRSDADDAGPVEAEPLTDEERIIALLEENGGRLKQGDVVETTEWSKAKVSRLLSSMEDDESIVRIQLGREKLIFLSGQEPSGARSTLENDD